MHSLVRRALVLSAVTLTALLTIWTALVAVMDFPLRWGGYLVLFCGLASVWSGLSLLRWKTGLTVFFFFLFLCFSVAGLPIVLIAFSGD